MQNGEESYLSDLAISRLCWCCIAAPCTPAADLLTVHVGSGVLCSVVISVTQQPLWAGESGMIIINKNLFLTGLDTQEVH